MNGKRIPLYLLVAIAGILISGSVAALLQYSSFPSDDSDHPGHGLTQSEAEAVKYPLEISDLYKLVKTQGDTDYGEAYLQYHEDVINSERSCEFCTLIEYTPGPKGQSEISFVSTKGYDLTGAKKATIFIMGSEGDETVRLKVAGKGQTQEEFAATTQPINLGNKWKKYEIDLTGNTDLKSITDAFKIVVKASDNQGEAVAFYIKHLTFESTNANNPVPLESPVQGANGG